jgi:Arc/MetJ-type ribon-helix-helix transcriptional regulator
MSTQITVRLPDDLVAFADRQVEKGRATSRADVVARALTREKRRAVALRDAAILARVAGTEPDDLDGLSEYAAAQPLDLD